MSKTEKPSFLTRAMIAVDQKMGRTPADGEVATPEAKAEVKNALIGAGVVVATGAAFVYGLLKLNTKAEIAKDELQKLDDTNED